MNNGTKKLISDHEPVIQMVVSGNGKYIMFWGTALELYVYNYDSDTIYRYYINGMNEQAKYGIDNEGDVYHSYYNSSSGYYCLIYKDKKYSQNYSDVYDLVFSKNGKVITNKTATFIANKNNNALEVMGVEASNVKNAHLNSDGTLLYYNSANTNDNNIYEYNIANKTTRTLNVEGTINSITDKDRLVINKKYLYNPISDEKETISISASGDLYYNEAQKRFIYENSEGKLEIYDMANDISKYSPKFLLSFDGQASWNTYKNGKWTKVSSETIPSYENLDKNGMTGEEVSDIIPLE